MHVNSPVMGNSFCMNTFWRPLKLTLPRAPNVLRPALESMFRLFEWIYAADG